MFIIYHDTTERICGTGETLRAAWADAQRQLAGESVAAMRTSMAQRQLVEAVRASGGAVRWYHDAARVARLSPA